MYQIKAVLKPEKNKKGKYLSYFFQSVSLRFYSVHLRDSEIWTLTEFAIPDAAKLLSLLVECFLLAAIPSIRFASFLTQRSLRQSAMRLLSRFEDNIVICSKFVSEYPLGCATRGKAKLFPRLFFKKSDLWLAFPLSQKVTLRYQLFATCSLRSL